MKIPYGNWSPTVRLASRWLSAVIARRRCWVPFCIVFSFVPCCGCLIWECKPFGSARQSDDVIREEILRATPLGSTKRAVEEYAKPRFEGSFFYTEPGPHGEAHSIWILDGDGKQYLAVHYGTYLNFSVLPYGTRVTVSWHFSDDGKLSKVWVARMDMGGPLDWNFN
jgi:hypothetical protein